MNAEVRFLTGLAQAMATMNLYKEGHPARERALDRVHEALAALQAVSARPRNNFLGTEVILDNRPVPELKHWDWAPRLSACGIQRIEMVGPVSRDDLDAFLDEVYRRLSGAPVKSAEIRQFRPSAIRYGELAVKDDVGRTVEVQRAAGATLAFSLGDELEGVEWLQNELRQGRQLQMIEAEGIVRSLSVAMHGDQAYLIPLVRLKEFDQYTVTHTINVAVLSMALAEYIGLSPREVRAFGIAGLLHDLGKVKVPSEILNKPGKLTEEERLVMNSHTVEGARLILETEEHLDLAAVVAYEHHIRIDKGGYPSLRYDRGCHQASNLVHVCDVYDALRTDRPYREAWSNERSLKIIEEGAGPEFDQDLARAFVQMMRQWEARVAEVSPEAPDLPTGAPAPGGPPGPGGPSA